MLREQGTWLVLRDLFNVSREANLPTFWNASLLVLLSAACALVACLATTTRLGWTIAAVTALALGADEIVRAHERLRGLGARLSDALPFGMPTYSWLLPGVVLAAAGAAAVWVWTGRLPQRTRLRLRIALATYGLGAIVVEALSGVIEHRFGVGMGYALVTAVEEGLEMTACVIAIAAVLGMLGIVEVESRRAALVPAERSEVDLGR